MTKDTVLVVDDDPSITGMLEAALEDQGYRVVAAVGDEALRLAHVLRPCVILLDLMMPEMDGVEMSRRLGADPETAHIPIVAMSTVQSLASLSGQMRADARLAKPFDLDHLYDTVEHCATASQRKAG